MYVLVLGHPKQKNSKLVALFWLFGCPSVQFAPQQGVNSKGPITIGSLIRLSQSIVIFNTLNKTTLMCGV